MNDYIKSDLYRYYGKVNIRTFVYGYVTNRAFRYQCAFRMCNSNGFTKVFGYILWVFSSVRKDIRLPIKTKVGYGLYIGHGGPIVINPHTTIGNNCNISQFVTIGSNNHNSATIGDNVYIGPSVCVVENVTIGDNVTIGAGSVVTKDIPANATAVGNYAKVINYNNPGRFINRRWVI